jgi:hypothetical protein
MAAQRQSLRTCSRALCEVVEGWRATMKMICFAALSFLPDDADAQIDELW